MAARDITDATITVRVIKSFPYRTCKNLVIGRLDLSTVTVGVIKDMVETAIKTQPGWKPYQTVDLDTLKLYSMAQGTKTQNLIINLDHDPEWIFDDDYQTLEGIGCQHETELSFFNRRAYEEYKADPVNKWE